MSPSTKAPRHLQMGTRAFVYRRSKRSHPTEERAINDLRSKVAYDGVLSIEETSTHWIITMVESPV